MAGAICVSALAQEANPNKAGSDAYNAAQQLYNAAKYAEAGKAFEAFLKDFPGHGNQDAGYYMATVSYYNACDYNNCIRMAQAHEKAFPGPTAYKCSSMRYATYATANTNKNEECIAIAERLLADAAYSDRYGLWYAITDAYSRLNQHDKRIAACDRFAKDATAPAVRRADMLLRKMDSLRALKKFDDAIAVAEEIVKLIPNTLWAAQAWEKVATIQYYDLKQYDKACESYKRAASEPTYTNAEYCMRMACVSLDNIRPADYAKTAAAFEEAIQKFPGQPFDATNRERLAQLQNALKEYAKELKTRLDLDQIYGKSAAAPANLQGIMNLASRDETAKPESMKAAQRLVAEHMGTPQAEQALWWLANQAKTAGDNEAAKKYLNTLIEKYPAGSVFPSAQKLLASIK